MQFYRSQLWVTLPILSLGALRVDLRIGPLLGSGLNELIILWYPWFIQFNQLQSILIPLLPPTPYHLFPCHPLVRSMDALSDTCATARLHWIIPTQAGTLFLYPLHPVTHLIINLLFQLIITFILLYYFVVLINNLFISYTSLRPVPVQRGSVSLTPWTVLLLLLLRPLLLDTHLFMLPVLWYRIVCVTQCVSM